MADRGDRLSGVGEVLRQPQRIRIDAQTVHVAGTAGDDQQIVVFDAHVGQQRVGCDGFTRIPVVEDRLARVERGGGQRDAGPVRREFAQRTGQLLLLDASVVDDDQYVRGVDAHMCSFATWNPAGVILAVRHLIRLCVRRARRRYATCRRRSRR